MRTSATRSTYSVGRDCLLPTSTLMLMLLLGSSNVQLGPLLAKFSNPRTSSCDASRPKGDADRRVAHELHRDGLSRSRPGHLLQPLPTSSCSLLQLHSALRRRPYVPAQRQHGELACGTPSSNSSSTNWAVGGPCRSEESPLIRVRDVNCVNALKLRLHLHRRVACAARGAWSKKTARAREGGSTGKPATEV